MRLITVAVVEGVPRVTTTWLVALAVNDGVLTQTCRACGASIAVELTEGSSTPALTHVMGCSVAGAETALAAGDRATAGAELAAAGLLVDVGKRCAS